MLLTLLLLIILVATTASMHVAGLTALLMILSRGHDFSTTGFGAIIRVLLIMTGSLIVLHLTEIALWGFFYLYQEYLPNAESALYFSGVTYTSIGYGDVVLTKPWRLIAPVQGLTGILMSGLSASVFFAVIRRLWRPGTNEATATGGNT
jgi:hypothetical protein